MMADASTVPTAQQWIAQGDSFETDDGFRITYRRRGAGSTVVMLHGFPTWSYDWAPVAEDLGSDHDVVTLDFLGYGSSEKPRGHNFTVARSADVVEQLLRHLSISSAQLVVHDYGGIVGQELLDRRRRTTLSFDISVVHVLNSGVVYSEYRPTVLQRLLAQPVVGPVLARLSNKTALRKTIDAVRGDAKASDEEFDNLWYGIALQNGHKLSHRLIRYNDERAVHHERWLSALVEYDGPLGLIWGLADPVSGQRVLDAIRALRPDAWVTALGGVGHFPQSEAPKDVARAIREHPTN